MIKKITQIFNDNFRLKRIFLTSISIIGTKGITMVVAFISMPLTLNYLGKERFGMMMTIVSIFSMMNFADLGLGYGLQNRLPEFEKKKELLHTAISSTFFFLCGVALLLLFFFLIIYPFISWHLIFNVKSEVGINEASLSALVFFCCFIFSIPISIVQKIQGGFQEGYFNNIWFAFGSVFGLGVLMFVIYKELGVPYIILSIYGSNTLFLSLNFLSQFAFKRKFLFPKRELFKTDILKIIIKDGILFTIIQVLFLIFVASDNIIISQVLGPEHVAVFAIGLKLISLMATPMDAVMNPSLPAINDAIEKEDKVWIKKLFKKGILLTLCSSFALIFVFYFSTNFIIALWLGEEYVLSSEVLIAFSIFILYFNANSFFSFFMLTKPMISEIVKIYPIAVTICILGKVLFCYLFGLSGLLISTSLFMIIFFFLPSFFKIKNLVK